ncbi:glycoside hydrolase family 10 protein [Stomatohabitans albus]|uniref:glycoside hydrolase family 10 protein n=1 Tax=Stomatohabitans albus TaxID=3110766 RepID=UPI00300CFF0F
MRMFPRLFIPILSSLIAIALTSCGFDESGISRTPKLPPASNLIRPAIHGLWVATTDPELDSPEGVTTLFDRAHNAGITDIYVQVNWRYATNWPSNTFLQVKADGRDVYEEVLTAGAERGMRVHAWMTVMLGGMADSPNELWKAHGLQAPEDQRWVTRSVDGRWSDFLDPGVPEVRKLAVEAASELAQKEPASVHLDFIRYPEDENRVPGSEWGYNPIALSRYYEETGKTEQPATDDPEWAKWKREQVTNIVRDIDAAVSPLPVSAAVVTWGQGPRSRAGFKGTSAWTDVMQDWPGWAEEGIVDQLVVMDYFDESSNRSYHASWAQFAGQLRSTYPNVQVLLGQGTWLNTTKDSLTQLARENDYVDGWALYANDKVPADLWPALPNATPEPTPSASPSRRAKSSPSPASSQ